MPYEDAIQMHHAVVTDNKYKLEVKQIVQNRNINLFLEQINCEM